MPAERYREGDRNAKTRRAFYPASGVGRGGSGGLRPDRAPAGGDRHLRPLCRRPAGGGLPRDQPVVIGGVDPGLVGGRRVGVRRRVPPRPRTRPRQRHRVLQPPLRLLLDRHCVRHGVLAGRPDDHQRLLGDPGGRLHLAHADHGDDRHHGHPDDHGRGADHHGRPRQRTATGTGTAARPRRRSRPVSEAAPASRPPWRALAPAQPDLSLGSAPRRRSAQRHRQGPSRRYRWPPAGPEHGTAPTLGTPSCSVGTPPLAPGAGLGGRTAGTSPPRLEPTCPPPATTGRPGRPSCWSTTASAWSPSTPLTSNRLGWQPHQLDPTWNRRPAGDPAQASATAPHGSRRPPQEASRSPLCQAQVAAIGSLTAQLGHERCHRVNPVDPNLLALPGGGTLTTAKPSSSPRPPAWPRSPSAPAAPIAKRLSRMATGSCMPPCTVSRSPSRAYPTPPDPRPAAPRPRVTPPARSCPPLRRRNARAVYRHLKQAQQPSTTTATAWQRSTYPEGGPLMYDMVLTRTLAPTERPRA